MQHRKKRMSCWTPPRARARKPPPATSQRNHSPKRERATTWKRPLALKSQSLLKKWPRTNKPRLLYMRKYRHLLTVFWRRVSMSRLYLNGKKTSRGQKIVNFSMWQRSTRRSGIFLKKQPEAWMPGYKKCKNHLSRASFPLPGLWELREKSLKRKGQCLLRMNFGKAYPTRCFW